MPSNKGTKRTAAAAVDLNLAARPKQKVPRKSQTSDAPTAAQANPPSHAVPSAKENNPDGRPVRTNRGQGGHAAQLASAMKSIRPDLEANAKQTGRGVVPDHVPENIMAPQPTGRGAAKKATQVQKPITRPIQLAEQPSFQVAAPGSRFGFVSQTGPVNPTVLETQTQSQAPQLQVPARGAPVDQSAQRRDLRRDLPALMQNVPTVEDHDSSRTQGVQERRTSNQFMPAPAFGSTNNTQFYFPNDDDMYAPEDGNESTSEMAWNANRNPTHTGFAVNDPYVEACYLPPQLPGVNPIGGGDHGNLVGPTNVETNTDAFEIDEASPSEDEANALAVLHGSTTDGSEDVLENHRDRNRAQRAPSCAQLARAAAHQFARSTNGDDDVDAADRDNGTATNDANDDDDDDDDDSEVEFVPTRAPRNSRKTTDINPTTLAFYPPEWKSFLQVAKQAFRLHIATVHAFPEMENHLHEARAVVGQLMHARVSAGDYLEPTHVHNRDVDVLVFKEGSTFRGTLKTAATRVVEMKYTDAIEPPEFECGNQLEEAHLIIRKVKALLANAAFAHYRPDPDAPSGNINHPALATLIGDFFYTGNECLAALFPQEFSDSVPEYALALAMTAIHNALDEYTTLGYKTVTIPFRGETYRPVFNGMLGLIEKCKAHPRHGPALEQNRRRWAQLGMRNQQVTEDQSYEFELV